MTLVSRFFCAVSAAVLLAGPAMAGTTDYTCTAKTLSNNGGWIAPEIFVRHQDGAKTGVVIDGLINHYNDGKPVEAKVSADNNRRVTFVWRVKLKTRTGQRTNMRYSMTVQKASDEMSISATPPGYSNTMQTRGGCTRKAG